MLLGVGVATATLDQKTPLVGDGGSNSIRVETVPYGAVVAAEREGGGVERSAVANFTSRGDDEGA